MALLMRLIVQHREETRLCNALPVAQLESGAHLNTAASKAAGSDRKAAWRTYMLPGDTEGE